MNIKKYQVIITPTAYREINKIYDYISYEFDLKIYIKKLIPGISPKFPNIDIKMKLYKNCIKLFY